MQKFEWYLDYLSRAANICGTYEASAVLRNLARMTPYGKIGLGSISGDGFAGPVCGRLNSDARELSGDADRIREYIEATYDCEGEDCYAKTLARDWQSHTCGETLAEHLSDYGVEEKNLQSVGFTNVRHSGATQAPLWIIRRGYD